MPVGKVVPKSFYKFEHTGESNWMETDLYHTGHVVKGTPHEVRSLTPYLNVNLFKNFNVLCIHICGMNNLGYLNRDRS